MLEKIKSTNYFVHFNDEGYQALNLHLSEKSYSKIFILVDSNTHQNCLAYFLSTFTETYDIEVIEIEPGELHKTIDTCSGVWSTLAELGCDRKSLLINLGGGVVTDLGGFVAATYMRGIDFVNIPTTLLAMVDASVGGKTGVDLGVLKNQVGMFATPQLIIIDTQYLSTLPANQMRSGMAEMLKHGLIANENYWNTFRDLSALQLSDLDTLIYDSVQIKNKVVLQDLKESNLRKTLNFGHTLGHAIESYFLKEDSKTTLLHGEAIAVGMILAAYLSHEKAALPINKVDEIKMQILNYFEKVKILEEDYVPIINLLKHDKKNSHGAINFVLLKSIGNPIIDIEIDNSLIFKAFEYYKK